MCYVFTIGLLDLVIIQATSSSSRMAPLVAFRCCLIMIIMYCSLLYVAENKLAVVVVLWNTEGAKRQGIYCTVKNV